MDCSTPGSYPWLSPGVSSNSCPLNRWCYLTISSSFAPFSFCLQSLPASGSFPVSRLFSSSGQSIGASASVLPSEHSGLISFRIDCFVLLAVQGILKSLLQHHSSEASILKHSAFFMVQLSHPYMTAGKTITLTRRTFVGKVMPLLFNMLSRFIIAFLLRSKCFLISWLHLMPTAILEPKKMCKYSFDKI